MRCYMEKYSIGERVVVKDDLALLAKYYMEGSIISDTFVEGMIKFLGKPVTIDAMSLNKYKIKEDNHRYNWTDEMFEETEDFGFDIPGEEEFDIFFSGFNKVI